MKLIISPKYYFRLSNGQIIKHIEELPDAINSMPESLFSQYVDNNKNDFARWVYDVFRLSDLSGILGNIKNKHETERVLRAYLNKIKYSEKKDVMRNSQESETVNPESEKPEHEVDNKRESAVIVKEKFVWKNKSNYSHENQETESKDKKALPEKEEKLDKDEPEKKLAESQKTVFKETNIHNISKENITDADKYFDENPVLVSQMVEHKKKNIDVEKIENITYKENEPAENVIDLFKNTYSRLYERLVFLRKNGFDTKIAQLMLFRIPSMIKVYEAAHEKKEAVWITRYLNEAADELNSINE